MTRTEIVTEAKTWIGTKWQHQACLKGVACDCVGLIRGVYVVLTGKEPDVPLDYPATWPLYKTTERLYNECLNYLTEIDVADAKIGDLLLFGFGKGPACHIGIKITDSTFIHSWQSVGKVSISRLDSYWTPKIRYAMQYPDVTG